MSHSIAATLLKKTIVQIHTEEGKKNYQFLSIKIVNHHKKEQPYTVIMKLYILKTKLETLVQVKSKILIKMPLMDISSLKQMKNILIVARARNSHSLGINLLIIIQTLLNRK